MLSSEFGEFRLRRLDRGVGRTIVDNENFRCRTGLLKNSLQGVADHRRAIVSGNNDRDGSRSMGFASNHE